MGEVEFVDLGWKALIRNIERMAAIEVEAGVIGDKAAEPHGDGRLTSGEVAVINEFGTDDGHVPPRPAVRNTLNRDGGRVFDRLSTVAKQVVNDLADPRRGLEDLGSYLVQEMRTTIARGVAPQNAPATIEKKQTAVPLIDDGQLIDAFSARVVASSEHAGDLDEAYEAFDVLEGPTAP